MEENRDTDLPEAGKEKTLLDIDAILLPKKEIHTSASAQRVNAGVLLEQEQHATLLKPEDGASDRKASGTQKSSAEDFLTPAPSGLRTSPQPSVASPNPESKVQPLQTYKDDIQKLLQKDKVSVVTIAAAEAGRRSSAPSAKQTKTPWPNLTKVVLITAGVLFLLGALGLIAYFFAPARSVPIEQALLAPFVAVDSTTVVNFGPDSTHLLVMGGLQDAKTNIKLSLGLVGRLLPTVSAAPGGTKTQMDAQTFLALVAPNIPPYLLRTVQPTFLLGIHSFDTNQPFLILKVDSYEQAYSGLLAWEKNMHKDLAPLFDYTPRQHIPEENLAIPTQNTAQFLSTAFVDRITLNHDARILQNQTGDIYFLWTFLDRNTLVITTQENTMREIISRAIETPIVPLPQ